MVLFQSNKYIAYKGEKYCYSCQIRAVMLMSVLSQNIWSMVDDKRHLDTEYIGENRHFWVLQNMIEGMGGEREREPASHGSIAFIKSSNILVPFTKLGTDEGKKVSVS